jgi:hypothetical protein
VEIVPLLQRFIKIDLKLKVPSKTPGANAPGVTLKNKVAVRNEYEVQEIQDEFHFVSPVKMMKSW